MAAFNCLQGLRIPFSGQFEEKPSDKLLQLLNVSVGQSSLLKVHVAPEALCIPGHSKTQLSVAGFLEPPATKS